MTSGAIRVLVVEDSPTAREFLVQTLDAAPGMTVAATAADGVEAVRKAHEIRPDVITMDIYMPKMDGLAATRRIMQECPVPIVVVSAMPDTDAPASFRALEAGAVAFVRRPAGLDDPAHATQLTDLVQTVRLMSEIKVVRRRAAEPAPAQAPDLALPRRAIDLLAVGASTGGPAAIGELLRALPVTFPAPILVVQHIAPGFVRGLAEWLGESTGHRIRVAENGDAALPGTVYLAPDDCQMGVSRSLRIGLADAPPEHGLRPSVSFLFRTMAEALGGRSAAVLLSGMGKDGAGDLLALRQSGAVTFAQDAASALVYGMPGEAVRLGAAQFVIGPAEIGAALGRMTGDAPRPRSTEP